MESWQEGYDSSRGRSFALLLIFFLCFSPSHLFLPRLFFHSFICFFHFQALRRSSSAVEENEGGRKRDSKVKKTKKEIKQETRKDRSASKSGSKSGSESESDSESETDSKERAISSSDWSEDAMMMEGVENSAKEEESGKGGEESGQPKIRRSRRQQLRQMGGARRMKPGKKKSRPRLKPEEIERSPSSPSLLPIFRNGFLSSSPSHHLPLFPPSLPFLSLLTSQALRTIRNHGEAAPPRWSGKGKVEAAGRSLGVFF